MTDLLPIVPVIGVTFLLFLLGLALSYPASKRHRSRSRRDSRAAADHYYWFDDGDYAGFDHHGGDHGGCDHGGGHGGGDFGGGHCGGDFGGFDGGSH